MSLTRYDAQLGSAISNNQYTGFHSMGQIGLERSVAGVAAAALASARFIVATAPNLATAVAELLERGQFVDRGRS